MKTYLFMQEGLQIAVTEKNEQSAKKRLEQLKNNIDKLMETEPVEFEYIPNIAVSFDKDTYVPTFTNVNDL